MRVAAGAILALNVVALAKFAPAAEPTNEGVLVNVVNATNECFSALVRVSGFLVPRAEAVVGIEADGSRITEVLVGDGDTVTSGQVIDRKSTRLNSSHL